MTSRGRNTCTAAADVLAPQCSNSKEAGKASRATDVRVVCKTCNTDRLVHDAFGPEAGDHLPRCRGRHPHLQRFDGACAQPTRALLLGASNAWFAVYRSALTIPTVTGDIDQKVAEHWDDLSDIDDRSEFDFIVKRLVKGAGEKALRWLLRYDGDDVWTAIVDRRGGVEGDIGTGDLRGPEWEAFTAAVPPESDDFEVRALDVPPAGSRRRWTTPSRWTDCARCRRCAGSHGSTDPMLLKRLGLHRFGRFLRRGCRQQRFEAKGSLSGFPRRGSSSGKRSMRPVAATET